jgi:hypothetical protein
VKYEVYGYTYLSDGVWGDMFIGYCDTLKSAGGLLESMVDGCQYTGGSVYVYHGEDYEGESDAPVLVY